MGTEADNSLIRVLIVDDSQFIRQTFRAWLNRNPAIKVVGTAGDATEATEMIARLHPDVLTLDVNMPMMDGVTFLKKVMARHPMPVVMVSALTEQGADVTVEALAAGAVDYVTKPSGAAEGGWEHTLTDLTKKVKFAAEKGCHSSHHATITPTKTKRYRFRAGASIRPWIIGIGASTGGVEALLEVLKPLPGDMPPIVIVQHAPPVFTASFARRLDKVCAMKVVEAQHHQKILPGHVYIAPGFYHLRIKRQEGAGMGQYWCELDEEEPVNGFRPSVNTLFDSLAQQAGKDAIGVILTGMGEDGADGLLNMREAGAMTFGQNQASCVVYGMPKAAQERGAVVRQLSLEALPQAIIHTCEEVEDERIESAVN